MHAQVFLFPLLVENEDLFPRFLYHFLSFSFLRCVLPFLTAIRIPPMETLFIPPGCHGEPGSKTTGRKLWRQDCVNDISFIYSAPQASISNRGELPLDSQLPPFHIFPRLSRPHVTTRIIVLFMHNNFSKAHILSMNIHPWSLLNAGFQKWAGSFLGIRLYCPTSQKISSRLSTCKHTHIVYTCIHMHSHCAHTYTLYTQTPIHQTHEGN